MGVTIKDMKMPWSCFACRFKVYDEKIDASRCVAYGDYQFFDAPKVETPTTKGRSSFCPLKLINKEGENE